ncbi:MAG: marine proteobacterial sortase target protein [Pseudomonadota bacterium]
MQHSNAKRKAASHAHANAITPRDFALRYADQRRQRFIVRLRRAMQCAMLLLVCALQLPDPAMATLQRTVSSFDEVASGALLMRSPQQSAQAYWMAPRLNAHVDIVVTGSVARTLLRQTFVNAGSEWVDAIYVFPLPDDAAVDHLTLTIGERTIVGEIQEREQARATFEAARKAGKKSALLSQERSNLFTTAVANIAPGEQVIIEIEYQQVVVRDGVTYSMRIPLTLTPRYIPGSADANGDRQGNGWSSATTEVADAAAITPSMLDNTHYVDDHKVTLNAQVDMGAKLARVESRYHLIDVAELPGTAYSITLAEPDVKMDHDIELSWALLPADAPQISAFSHSTMRSDYVLLQMMPPTTDDALTLSPRELILVVDTSGSMHGVSMQQARAAVQYAISQLRPIDRFNVIEFNNRFRSLFQHSVDATQANRAQAIAWVHQLQANGGTEMRPALLRALEGDRSEGMLRQVIFVTDGAVGNEEGLFRDIETRLGDNRLFTVGIGSAPNGWFMRKASELGRGTFTTISAIADVESRMQQLFRRLAAPVLTDVQFDWHGTTVSHYPNTVPDLYFGEPINLAAEVDPERTTPLRVTMRATHWAGGRPVPWQQELLVDSLGQVEYPAVGVLWARKRLEALADERRRGRDAEVVRLAMLDVALEHHLVSEVTSLVAVDQTPVRSAAQKAVRREVASLMPHGQSLSNMTSTATPARLQQLAGLALIMLALAMLAASRVHSLGVIRARWRQSYADTV